MFFLPKGGKGYVWAENKIDIQIMLGKGSIEKIDFF